MDSQFAYNEFNLKPCPFCGQSETLEILTGNEIDDRDSGDDEYAVICAMGYNSNGCGAEGGFRETKQEAAWAWNMRASDGQ